MQPVGLLLACLAFTPTPTPDLVTGLKISTTLCYLLGSEGLLCSKGFEDTKKGLMLCAYKSELDATRIAAQLCENARKVGR